MRFIYIGRVNLPTDAASIRVYNVGAALKARGHQVDYICQEGFIDGGETVLEGSTYYGVFNKAPDKTKLAAEWLFGGMAAARLKELLAKKKYDGVVLYNVAFHTFQKIWKICRAERLAVIGDITEWYEINPQAGLFSMLYAYSVDQRIRKCDHQCDGVIAISNYLENYYKDKVAVLNMPPVFGGEGKPNTSANGRPRFFYAGSPSKKDELSQFVDALMAVNSNSIVAEMTIIGAPIPSESKQYAEKGVFYLPRMPHKEVLSLLGEHDFSVILRREARYAKAGYSTKVAEALFNGTPVFCNEIGGADMDIENDCNGIKIASVDACTIGQAIRQIVALPQTDIAKMKAGAYHMAEEKYSRQKYEERLERFFSACVSKQVSM